MPPLKALTILVPRYQDTKVEYFHKLTDGATLRLQRKSILVPRYHGTKMHNHCAMAGPPAVNAGEKFYVRPIHHESYVGNQEGYRVRPKGSLEIKALAKTSYPLAILVSWYQDKKTPKIRLSYKFARNVTCWFNNNK